MRIALHLSRVLKPLLEGRHASFQRFCAEEAKELSQRALGPLILRELGTVYTQVAGAYLGGCVGGCRVFGRSGCIYVGAGSFVRVTTHTRTHRSAPTDANPPTPINRNHEHKTHHTGGLSGLSASLGRRRVRLQRQADVRACVRAYENMFAVYVQAPI